MNNPVAKCSTYFIDELTQVADAVAILRPAHTINEPLETLDDIMNHEADDNSMNIDFEPGDPNGPIGAEQSPVADANKYFTEEHPSRPQVYGKGTTFMDQFGVDKYSHDRLGNIYYPFASRQEWEIASFLLRSSLSMVKIDKFLSLELVCSQFRYTNFDLKA
jgi:hypothetical protein